MPGEGGRQMFAVAPLFNFESPSRDPIQIFPGIALRPTTSDDRGGGSAAGSLFEFMLRQMPTIPSGVQFTWVLSGEWVQPREAGVLQSLPILESFNRTVDALHLIHDEMVAFPFMAIAEGGPPNYTHGSSGFPCPSNDAWQKAWALPYVLTPQERGEVPALARTVDTAIRADAKGAASLAVSRLNLTHLRSSDADRIIDSAIALEAILLKGAEHELAYRQAIRGAHLLGGDAADRRETFNLLRKAYERRSKIVHGVTDPGTPSVSNVISITRRVVRAFLERPSGESHEGLIHLLDARAIGTS